MLAKYAQLISVQADNKIIKYSIVSWHLVKIKHLHIFFHLTCIKLLIQMFSVLINCNIFEKNSDVFSPVPAPPLPGWWAASESGSWLCAAGCPLGTPQQVWLRGGRGGWTGPSSQTNWVRKCPARPGQGPHRRCVPQHWEPDPTSGARRLLPCVLGQLSLSERRPVRWEEQVNLWFV